MKDIPLKDRIKKMRKFIQDNNLSDKKTFQSTDIPKDKNGFIDFNKIKLWKQKTEYYTQENAILQERE